MTKAIFFDAAGTLLHLRGSVGEHYAAVARQLGIELSPDEFDRAFSLAWNQAPNRPAVNGAREDDDRPWWRDLVNVIISNVSNLPEGFDGNRFFELAYTHFSEPGVWVLFPEVREVLELLAPKYTLGVISNFDRRLFIVLHHLKVASCFRHVLVSSELGADKPDPEIFRRALNRTGFPADEVLHVGDDPARDWQAARAAGMHVFQLDRPRKSLRDLPAYLEKQAR